MGKAFFFACENKGENQLRSNCSADQRLCFHYIDSTTPLLSKSEISSLFSSCTAQFVSHLVVNSEDRFSRDGAHFIQSATYFVFVSFFSVFAKLVFLAIYVTKCMCWRMNYPFC